MWLVVAGLGVRKNCSQISKLHSSSPLGGTLFCAETLTFSAFMGVANATECAPVFPVFISSTAHYHTAARFPPRIRPTRPPGRRYKFVCEMYLPRKSNKGQRNEAEDGSINHYAKSFLSFLVVIFPFVSVCVCFFFSFWFAFNRDVHWPEKHGEGRFWELHLGSLTL